MGILEQLLDRVAKLEARIAELDKPAPSMVDVATYAAARSIGESTVRGAIREGRLRAVKIGRAVRIPSDAEIARPIRVRAEADTPAARADRVLARITASMPRASSRS